MAPATYPTVEEALAAVRADHPDAQPEPDLAALFAPDTHVLYDPQAHLVFLVGPTEVTPGQEVGKVETCPGHELPGFAPFYENLEGGTTAAWGADNTRILRALEAMTRIYTAAQRHCGLLGKGPSDHPDVDVYWALENEIGRLRERLFALEAVRVRFLRGCFQHASTREEREQIAKEFHLELDGWQDMLIADHRRFGTIS